MKKLLVVIAFTFALNFLLLIGALAYMLSNGTLTKEKIALVKAVFAPASAPTTTAATQAVIDPSTQPSIKLEELLAKVSGRSAGEQVEFMQRTFDAKMAELDRRMHEMQALQVQIDGARAVLVKEQGKLKADQLALATREKTLTKQLDDKNFNDTMAMLEGLPTKQVKELFSGMDDSTAVRYLRAMEPDKAAKILKEFKTPTEATRVRKLMEIIRTPQADAAGK